MKSIKILLSFLVFAMLLASPVAFAQEAGDNVVATETITAEADATAVADAGVTPDSVLYTFDVLADDISVALTFYEA